MNAESKGSAGEEEAAERTAGKSRTPEVEKEELEAFLSHGDVSDDLRERIRRSMEEEPDGWVARRILESERNARNWLNVDWSNG